MQVSPGLGASPVGVDADGTVPGGREGPEQPVIFRPVKGRRLTGAVSHPRGGSRAELGVGHESQGVRRPCGD